MSTVDTVKHFNAYDSLYKQHYGKYIQAYRPTQDQDLELYINELIKPQCHEIILDCGSGFGSVAEQILPQSKKVYAINICRQQIPPNQSNVNYIHGDFDKIDLIFKGKGIFDKIVFIESLGYSKDINLLFRKCKELLKTHGKLILKEFFTKNLSNKKLQDLQDKSIYLTKKIYNYNILDRQNIKNITKSLDFNILSINPPAFECNWTRSFNFERTIIDNQNQKIIHKNTQKDNLFECLEIIAEKT